MGRSGSEADYTWLVEEATLIIAVTGGGGCEELAQERMRMRSVCLGTKRSQGLTEVGRLLEAFTCC